MRTRQPVRMKVIQQPRVTALARQQLHDGKLNRHDLPLAPACFEFTTLALVPYMSQHLLRRRFAIDIQSFELLSV